MRTGTTGSQVVLMMSSMSLGALSPSLPEYPGIVWEQATIAVPHAKDLAISVSAARCLISRRHRIGTAEVESALVSHELCAEAAVVGFDHTVKGQVHL